MKVADRNRLTAALREHVGRMAADLRAQMRVPGLVRENARKLHADEQVGDDFDVWTDLLSRRAAVLWVLKSVYVRVLEDRGLLSPGRLLDPEAQQLFEQLAPNLGETAFLRWVYRDLASRDGGLPELFSPQPAEVALPSDALSRALIEFWRHKDPDTGARWTFAEERFEGELMGDLYQELDPVVKDRFALCQTPDFVRAFILDRTLTPAIEEFGADTVRLLDPACGSGHFLIDGLKRLIAATREQHPDWEREKVVTHCLERVVGIDLNDYACALARARLIMTAAELAGRETLAEAARFHPHVYWADGLEQVEKGEATVGDQLELFAAPTENMTRGTLTRPEVRVALRNVLAPKFQAVVGNPPYITEKDPARKEYHREKIGGQQRYVSAYREYSLASPFTERCFQLADANAFLGLITSNNFMKREFGRSLIENVLSQRDLTMVVDTSQAHIPHHGTATVTLFARNRRPTGDRVHAVMGKRGEAVKPADPAKGRVWASIAEGWEQIGFENEYVSVAELPRETLQRHPWSLGGGGAAQLREVLGSCSGSTLADHVESVGFMCITKQDDVFVNDVAALRRHGCERDWLTPFGMGDMIRDWQVLPGPVAIFPYDASIGLRPVFEAAGTHRFLWRLRRVLEERAVFGGESFRTAQRSWWEYGQIPKGRFRTPHSIAFAFVATHNHFVLDRGGKVFNRSAPVIKLRPDATEDEHLSLLGALNSSAGCFWMKQVFQAKAAGGIGRGLEPEPWMERYEHDGTKIKLFPIPAHHPQTIPYARALDNIATQRTAASVSNLLADTASWADAPSLRHALHNRRTSDEALLHRMVALQEELDWLCYGLYGLFDPIDLVPPEAVDPMPPTWLPYLLNLATHDTEIRDALARSEDPEELPTAWFERHRWTPVLELPEDVPPPLRERIRRRREIIAQNPSIALIETATFKRRWYRPDYEAEEKTALENWLADATEAVAETRSKTFTLEQLSVALQDDARVLAVAEVLTGRPDFHLRQLVGQVIDRDCVPFHPTHTYKDAGLTKRAAWEKTWLEQRREDAGEKVTPEVPPTYASADFLKNTYWQLRGKLDVPKERFIVFTEVPGRNGDDTLYGWAGWTPLQRLKAILAIDEDLEDQGIPLADRIGLLDSAWRVLPWVAQDDPSAANRLKAELQAVVGEHGLSREMIEEWRKRYPPPGSRTARTKKSAPKGRPEVPTPAPPPGGRGHAEVPTPGPPPGGRGHPEDGSPPRERA